MKKRPAVGNSPEQPILKNTRPKQTERHHSPLSPAWAGIAIENDAKPDLAIPAHLKNTTVVTFCPTAASPLPSLGRAMPLQELACVPTIRYNSLALLADPPPTHVCATLKKCASLSHPDVLLCTGGLAPYITDVLAYFQEAHPHAAIAVTRLVHNVIDRLIDGGIGDMYAEHRADFQRSSTGVPICAGWRASCLLKKTYLKNTTPHIWKVPMPVGCRMRPPS